MFMENDTPQNDASEYIFWFPRSDNINDLYNTRLFNILREEAEQAILQAA